ncbi:MAG: N-acetyltransferase [Anaerolineae bacterium]|nr:N-acetyltransferase [Anaerolineae bacterium]
MIIRPETPHDIDAIYELTRTAFAPMSFSDKTEHLIVNALREQGALTLSLVAEHEGQVVGHVAFSPATISDGSTGWFALGPISVSPLLQRRGIGRQLVAHGLAALRQLGGPAPWPSATPAILQRYGFLPSPARFYSPFPAVHFRIYPLRPHTSRGEISFHTAFDVK